MDRKSEARHACQHCGGEKPFCPTVEAFCGKQPEQHDKASKNSDNADERVNYCIDLQYHVFLPFLALRFDERKYFLVDLIFVRGAHAAWRSFCGRCFRRVLAAVLDIAVSAAAILAVSLRNPTSALYHLNGKQDEQCSGERMRPRVLVSAACRNQLRHAPEGCVFSAKGAAFIAAWGSAPGMRACQKCQR